MSYQDELKVIEKAVRLGGRKALEMRPDISAAQITAKGGDPRDILTEADPAVQQVIFSELRREFPDITLIGEEGSTRAELEKLAMASDKILVDPIDGTTNYTRHTSFQWGTTACLLKNNKPVAGVVYLPAIDVMITASTGNGCYVNGEPRIAVGTVPLQQSIIGVEWYFMDDQREQKQLALIKAARGTHANLSAVYSAYQLVQGEIDAYLNLHIPGRSGCVWDFAACHLFLQEMMSPQLQNSGGFFPDGTPLSYRDRIGMEALLTPYPKLAEEIVAQLK